MIIVSLSKNNFINSFANKTYHYVDKAKFFILGEGFFIYPKEEFIDQKVIIHLNSSAKKIVCNIKPYFYKDSITTNLDNLVPLIILGNEDFYTNEPVKNTKLIVWSIDKDLGNRINSIAGKALERHKNFWQDINFDQIAIFIPNPFITNLNKWGGRVIGNTITGFINPNTNQDEEIYNLVNHEDLHFWFGCGLIKGPAWFTEGFSDYYMDKINYHFLADRNGFIDNYNDKLKKYFLSPFKNLGNNYFNDHDFNYKATQKLPYLKGYLIAGQIDSIIDLDKALRSMLKTCRIDNKNCHFSKELLFKHADDITVDKKNKITKLIDNFNADYLINSFLNIAYLDFRQTQGFEYDINIINIIKDKLISGEYLNKLDHKYVKNKFYNISELIIGDNNILHFFLENKDKTEEFFPIITPISAKIPYYK